MRALDRYSKQPPTKAGGSISFPCDISFTADSGRNWSETSPALRSDGSGSTWTETHRFIIRLHFHEYASIIRKESFGKDCKMISEIILTSCVRVYVCMCVRCFSRQLKVASENIVLLRLFFSRIHYFLVASYIFVLSVITIIISASLYLSHYFHVRKKK